MRRSRMTYEERMRRRGVEEYGVGGEEGSR